MKVQLIVEGHGEVTAFPVLLRRLRDEAQAFNWDFGKPIRQKRSQLVEEQSLRTAVRLARLQPDCDGLIVLLDGDDDCPAELGPRLHAWAQAEAGEVPAAAVVAQREYEAWFLAGLEPVVPDPEEPRDAKGRLDAIVGRYLPTVDQASQSASLDLARAHKRSRSFRHLVSSFGRIVVGPNPEIWPPAAWLG